MTATSSSDAGAPPGAAAPGGHADGRREDAAPVQAGGVELLGELPGSGYRQAPSLVRRADGQTIQLTRLLYLVLEAVDGARGYEEIADAVSARAGRLVSPDDVRVLTESKLRPLGLLRLADGSEPAVRRSDPLLGLRFRFVVSDPEVTRRITAPFAWLFRPPVVLAVVVAFALTSGWVLFDKGLASATFHAFDSPGLLLLVFALTVVSAGFHEFGHAAACRYGGATPGAMGTGLYLVWPAFYTDVSDSYRLGRGGRVRVDLGGLYFNAIVAVAMFGAWAATRWDALLLIIAAQVLQMVRQLAPLVRFDGYHVLADLTGVPDLYSRITPTLLGLLPTRWGSAESKVLKPWARVVVSVWVLVVVPLLLLCLVLMVMALPRVVATAWQSLGTQWQVLDADWADGDLPGIGVRLLSVLAICLPLLGMGYLLARLVRQTTTATWRATAGRPARRAVAAVVAAAVVAAVGWAWWPDGDTYRPIRPDERGTILDAVPTAHRVGAPPRAGLQEGRVDSARTIWPATGDLPTVDDPRLALVLVPQARDGSVTAEGSAADAPPTWVFPFDRPPAPGEGDNQALAVNTEDGSTRYDVAFALVWATDGSATNRNEAYALASCRDCRTVAVAFQVVLVLGQADVVVPQNLSAAVNYSCLECLTYALATQLVVTLPDGMSEDATARLLQLWEEIRQFGEGIEDVPLDQIRARLVEYESAILDIVREDAERTPTGEGGPSDAATASPTATSVPGTTGATAPAPASSPSTGTPTTASTQAPSSGPTSTPSTTAPSPTSTTAEPSPTGPPG